MLYIVGPPFPHFDIILHFLLIFYLFVAPFFSYALGTLPCLPGV